MPERKVEAPAPLVDALFDAAGVRGPWRVVEVAAPGRVNTSTIIEAAGGERVVARVYGWPFGGQPVFDRRAKEAWLHPRLAAAGVPVPQVLAVADHGDVEGALLEWMPGELLGTVAARHPETDLTIAWREAGAALHRAHGLDLGLDLGRDSEGFVTAGGLVAFPEGSLATRICDQLVAFSSRVAPEAPTATIDPGRIRAVARALQPVLAAAPRRFGHSDANPWNVLVAPDADGTWRLSAWLDWEFAWIADPAYDDMRATEQRFAPIGPTPDGWWQGDGARPDPVRLDAYALHLLLWKADEHLDGLDSPETRLMWARLASVPERVTRLEDRLAR